MPTKKGAGGKQQNYDPATGRYSHMNPLLILNSNPGKSKKERAQYIHEHERDRVYNAAINSKDKYLFDVFKALENNFYKEVLEVNKKIYDENSSRVRELDIVCKDCIIEVKSGTAEKSLKQFMAQKIYAASRNKNHIVFAPNISNRRKYVYEQNGITICTKIGELLRKVSEIKNEKLHTNNKTTH